MENHSNILDGIIPWTETLAGYSLWGCKELDMTKHTNIFLIYYIFNKIMHSNCFFNKTYEKLYSKNALTLLLQDFFHLPIGSHICVCVCLLLDFLHENTNKCKLIYILFSLHALMMATDCLTYIFLNIIISWMSHH